MKIALITTDAREMSRRYGDTLPDIAPAPQALLQGFAGIPEVEVHVLSCTQRPMSSPPKLDGNIFFHSLHVPKIGWLRTGYQGCIRAVRRKLREIQPDVVHGQGTERECAISAVFSGFPNVITIHGNMRLVAQVHRAAPLTFKWLAARLEALTVPRTGGVVCITDYTRRAVASLARKTWLVPNAVDASFFEIDRRPAFPPRVLCVGTIDQRKNQNALIRALDALQPQGKFELIFLGTIGAETAYGKEFEQFVSERDWCRYEGFADRETLKAHLSEAAGLVLPSLEDNCPMVVLEAMAAGVPVAAAEVGGVPDLVRDGETGWLLDPLDNASMARAIQSLFNDSAGAMVKTAKEEARQRFHPEQVAREHLAVYRELLSKDR